MTNQVPLTDALRTYQQALDQLEAGQKEDKPNQRNHILEVLTARDAVQHCLEDEPAVSAPSLVQLAELDQQLKNERPWIVRHIDLEHWRSLVNPPADAWWWHLEPPALFPALEKRHAWLDRLDWFWTFLSLFSLSLALTVVFDTLNRVVGEGLNTQGMFPIVVQVLLTIAGGSAALTDTGREFLRSQMARLRLPKHYWQEFSAVASVLVLLIVVGIHELYLPQLANGRYQAGIAHHAAGQFDSALQAYRQSLALQPDRVANYYSLGLVYEDLQQTEDAIAAYQRIVSQDANALDQLTWVRAHNNLGRLYILDEQYRMAWTPLARAWDAVGDDSDKWTEEMQVERYNLLKNLGWMWLGQERLIEANEFLNQAIDLNPQRAAAHCLQAQVWQGLEQKKQAQAAWMQCLSSKQRNAQPEEAEWAAMAREQLEMEQQQ